MVGDSKSITDVTVWVRANLPDARLDRKSVVYLVLITRWREQTTTLTASSSSKRHTKIVVTIFQHVYLASLLGLREPKHLRHR